MAKRVNVSKVLGKPKASEDGHDSVYRRIAWWALVATVLLVPLALATLRPLGIDRSPMADAFSLPKVIVLRVFTLVSFAAWAAHVLTRGGRIRWHKTDLLVLAFLGWSTLATIFSVHPATAVFGKYTRDEGLLALLNYALIYFLAMQLVDDARRVKTLAMALVAASIPVAVYGIVQYFDIDPIPWNRHWGLRAFGTYGNPDMLGGFLMFTVPVALALMLAETNTRLRVVFGAGFFLNVMVLVLSFTRGAWVGAIFGVGFALLIARRNGARLRRVDAIPAAVAAIAVAAVLIAQQMPGSQTDHPLIGYGAQRLTTADADGVGSRLLIWQAALRAIADRPILGSGPDTFRFVFPEYKTAEYVSLVSDNVADSTHNYPLQMAVDAGVPGFLMVYGLFAWIAIASASTVFGKSTEPRRVVVGALWSGSAGYLASMMFGVSIPGAGFLLWLAMGILIAPKARAVSFAAPGWGGVVASGVAVLAAAGVFAQVPIVMADHQYVEAVRWDAQGKALAAGERAVELNPFNIVYREQLGVNYLNEAVRLVGEATKVAQAGGDPQPYLAAADESLFAGEQRMLSTLASAPRDYALWLHLSQIYNIRGDMIGDAGLYQKALDAAGKGMALDAYAVAVRVQYAYALRATGRAPEALALMESALEVNPAHAEGALLLAELYQAAGRDADALAVVKRVEELYEGQPGIAEAIEKLESGQKLSQ